MTNSYLIRVKIESLAVTRVALEQLGATIEYEYPGANFTDLLVLLTVEQLDQLAQVVPDIIIVHGL